MGIDLERAQRRGLDLTDPAGCARTAPADQAGNNWKAWTDGSCQPNPGAGGWAVILCAPDGTQQELAGSARRTTNNRMELEAISAALRNIPKGAAITIFSDSEYSIYVLTGRKRGKKNHDLIGNIRSFAGERIVDYRWVRGHNGNRRNEQADALARRARLCQL